MDEGLGERGLVRDGGDEGEVFAGNGIEGPGARTITYAEVCERMVVEQL